MVTWLTKWMYINKLNEVVKEVKKTCLQSQSEYKKYFGVGMLNRLLFIQNPWLLASLWDSCFVRMGSDIITGVETSLLDSYLCEMTLPKQETTKYG